ncbi:MAG: hypothetical protein ABI780_15005, partial [Ardenticatenales bacterium]
SKASRAWFNRGNPECVRPAFPPCDTIGPAIIIMGIERNSRRVWLGYLQRGLTRMRTVNEINFLVEEAPEGG